MLACIYDYVRIKIIHRHANADYFISMHIHLLQSLRI